MILLTFVGNGWNISIFLLVCYNSADKNLRFLYTMIKKERTALLNMCSSGGGYYLYPCYCRTCGRHHCPNWVQQNGDICGHCQVREIERLAKLCVLTFSRTNHVDRLGVERKADTTMLQYWDSNMGQETLPAGAHFRSDDVAKDYLV